MDNTPGDHRAASIDPAAIADPPNQSDSPRRLLGRWGEDLTVRYLQDCGWQVLERNWRCPLGEIDVVALEGNELVIVEVKARTGLGYGAPIEAVTRAKAIRLRRLAAAWCASARERQIAPAYSSVRVDVVGILHRSGAAAQVRHLRAVA